jgi:hypothetical protein
MVAFWFSPISPFALLRCLPVPRRSSAGVSEQGRLARWVQLRALTGPYDQSTVLVVAQGG